MTLIAQRIVEAISILTDLGLPRAQINERSALTLLALLDLRPSREWSQSKDPLIGITPMMNWFSEHYGKTYKPNTRETVRRQTIHQFLEAAIALENPDDPTRPVNSPKTVYQISPRAHALMVTFGTPDWGATLAVFRSEQKPLSERYAAARETFRVPVEIAPGTTIKLSPGDHSVLIRDIISQFGSNFAPGSKVVYVGDTGDKWGYFDTDLLGKLGVTVDAHGKMPDVVLYYGQKNWLLLIESVTSHGPVDGKRHAELMKLFKTSKAGLVYVTAFPTRAIMAKYLGTIAWETEVWVSEAPSHLIHFNGERFLGPYKG